LTDTQSQVLEFDAFKRYDKIQGLTATAQGGKMLLEFKTGLELESFTSGFKETLPLTFIPKGESPDFKGITDRVADYIAAGKGYADFAGENTKNWRRGLGAGMSAAELDQVTALLEAKGLKVMRVNGADLEDEGMRDQVRGGHYENYLEASDDPSAA